MRNADFGLRNKKSKLMKFRVWNFDSGLRSPNSPSPSPSPSPPRGEGWRGCTGFTFIEIIVVIVILAIVSAITIKFLTDSLQIYTETINQKTLFDEGKLALERMCRDIRDASAITGTTASSITFTRAHTTATDNAGDSITFWQNTAPNPDTLEKTNSSTGTSGILANNVNSFTVANAANEIQLQLTLSLASGENVTLQTKVYPKNLPKNVAYKNFYQYWMEAIQ